MQIYTRKRAMLMRSVDRRNDSFGADTEGFALSSQRKAQITRRNAVSAQIPKKFALSSQRKLSVLLVVGIIILSAKECEMGPVVGNPLVPTKTVKVAHGANLAAGDAFSGSLAFAGDLDGGGGTVLAVGAAEDATGGSNRGAIYLLSYNDAGVLQSTKKIAHGVDETNGTADSQNAMAPTLVTNDFFGRSIANAGDLDGGGGTVLAVGTFGSSIGGTSQGAIYLLSFDPDGALQNIKKIGNGVDETNGTADSQNALAPTPTDHDAFGGSIANAGNLYGDGNTVLAVGAQGEITDRSRRGAIYLLSFNASGSLTDTKKIAHGVDETNGDHTLAPTLADNGSFGSAIANAGDLDGGGGTVLAVGAIGGATLHLLSFSATGALEDIKKIAEGLDETNAGSNANAPVASNGFGISAIANVGDLNGGGGTVLAVGNNGDHAGGWNIGSVHLLSFDATGSLTAKPTKIAHGTASGPVLSRGYFFGISLASASNLDGSGGTVLAAGGGGSSGNDNDTGELQLLYFSPATKK